jgi:hypothetical protein
MVIGVGDAYLDVIRSPKYGYGTQMNPCVDCRIYMFRIAKRYMEEIGAGFVATGEVLGQRPMSQRRHPLEVIEHDSGLEGLLLRPLSAKVLEPTLPELDGAVDRNRLLGLSGRSRHEQMELAKGYGITGYSQPAGGCQLTDANFATKVKDLFAHEPRPTTRDMELLTVGRHLRLSPTTKVILGRNQLENLMLEGYAEDLSALIVPKFAGPTALIDGPRAEAITQQVLRLIVQHAKPEKLPETLEFRSGGQLVSVERSAFAQTESIPQMVNG